MMLLKRRPSKLPTRFVSTFPDAFSFRVFSLQGSIHVKALTAAVQRKILLWQIVICRV